MTWATALSLNWGWTVNSLCKALTALSLAFALGCGSTPMTSDYGTDMDLYEQCTIIDGLDPDYCNHSLMTSDEYQGSPDYHGE